MAITDQPLTHELPAIRTDGFWDGVARSYIPAASLTVDPSLELHTERAEDVIFVGSFGVGGGERLARCAVERVEN